MGLDISNETIGTYADVIKKLKTILWNGPMGVLENDGFEKQTKQVALAIAEQLKGAYTLIGGGDSVAAVNKYNLAEQVSCEYRWWTFNRIY